jgi:hypothetical protein
MESYESHRPRCSIEEAYQIMEQSTYILGKIAYKCYENSYNIGCQKYGNEPIWNQHCAFASVYMMGFLSGARAVRERKHLQQANKSKL